LDAVKFTKYSSYLDDAAKCRYRYATTACNSISMFKCTGIPYEQGDGWETTVQACVNLQGEPARCAETCQDLQKAGYQWPTK